MILLFKHDLNKSRYYADMNALRTRGPEINQRWFKHLVLLGFIF